MRVAEIIDGDAPILLLADHAGVSVPDGIALGVAEADMARHIASDLGTDALTRALSARLNASAILARVTRLVVDLNRARDDPAALPTLSDGTTIPGNAVSAEAAEERLARWHDSYHHAVERWLSAHSPALIVSLHSFTPTLVGGERRPWDAGVLYNRDVATGRAMLAALEGDGWIVGDQQPYPGTRFNATLDRHTGPSGRGAGVPSVLIEVRQDHLATSSNIERVASRLARAIDRVVARGRGPAGTDHRG